MSLENVEAVRRGIEEWNRGDRGAYLELVEGIAHPDIAWYPVIAQLVEGQETVYRGLDGMRRFWDDWHDVFDFHFEETEIRDLGDTVLVLSQASVKGRASGVSLETPLAMVITFERGLMLRQESYLDHAEALDAVGLSA